MIKYQIATILILVTLTYFTSIEATILGAMGYLIIKDFTPSQGDRGIGCKCSKEETTGKTSIMCCNQCGKPTEGFWTHTGRVTK